MPPLPDDDENKWQYQAHSKAKHDVLDYYLTTWARIVSNENYKLRVFDCFAGRGEYLSSDGTDPYSLRNLDTPPEYPGSPQILLDVLTEHNNLFKSADCFLIEPNDNNREALQRNINKTDGIPDNVHPKIRDGEFETKVPELIRKEDARKGFAFFFMDPFGLKNLDYDVVTNICGTDGFDSLITLMTKELIRWQDSAKHSDSFETLYGTPEWKSQLESYKTEQLYNKEAEYYCHRLREGGPKYTLAYMTTEGDSRSLMYHLVFTTNDEMGIDKMKESMMRCGTDYTLAYAPERSEIHAGQTTITGGNALSDKQAAESYLLTQFAGDVLTFDEVVQKMVVQRPRDKLLRQDYRDLIKELHNDEQVDIPQRSKPDGALKEKYTILFPELEKDD